jgi:hypothetical protein
MYKIKADMKKMVIAGINLYSNEQMKGCNKTIIRRE